MKRTLFKILRWSLGIGSIILLFWLVRFAGRQRLAAPNSGYDIQIGRRGGVYLHDRDVERWLDKSVRWKEGTVGELNPSLIEHTLRENPYVKDAQVYFTSDAKLHLDVRQREPYLRVYAPDPFYLDEDGRRLPVNTAYPCRLRVCTMEGKATEERLARVFALEGLLRRDSLLDAMIDQMHLNRRDEIELISKVGVQRIQLGTFDRVEEKLANTVLFYRKGMPLGGWDRYAVLNLKYKGQVVAVRR